MADRYMTHTELRRLAQPYVRSDAPPYGPTLVWGYGDVVAFDATGLTCIDEVNDADRRVVEIADPDFGDQEAAGAKVWLAVVEEGDHAIAALPYEQRAAIRHFFPRHGDWHEACCAGCAAVVGLCPVHGRDLAACKAEAESRAP
jgi:hypothetical protein